MSRRLLALACLALASHTTMLRAQETRSSSTGLTLGASLLGSAVSTNFENVTVTENGGGLNLEVGWGFTPQLTVFLGLNGSTIEADTEYTLGQADLGLRYLFRGTDKRARPYLEGALAGRQIEADVLDGAQTVTVKASSSGLTFGGGVQLFASPRVAFDIGLNYSLGSFSDWTANGVSFPFRDIDATSTNFRLGMRFWPAPR